MTPEEKQAALRQVAFFGQCSPDKLHDLAAIAQERELVDGDALCREGDFAQEVFVVLEGEAVATREGAEIGRIGPGEVVGELAMLGDGFRKATLTADVPMRVLVMDPDFVDAVVAADPGTEGDLGPRSTRADRAPE